MSYDEHQGPMVERDTDNATTFHAQDAPDIPRQDGPVETTREHYKRLFTEYQTGNYNGSWGDRDKIRSNDNNAMFDSIASQLDLPTFLRKRGRQVIEDMNIREYGRPARLIVFCLCARIYNTEAADEYRYHPNRSDDNNPDRFLEMADDLGLSDRDINSVYNKLEAEV